MGSLAAKSDIESALNTKKNNVFNTSLTWTKNTPPHANLASWFENANTTQASLNVGNPMSADQVVTSIRNFVSAFSNYRKVHYVQQYTYIRLNSKGGQMSSELRTEYDNTNKAILSSSGASSGSTTYKPGITDAGLKDALIVGDNIVNYDNMINAVNTAITKWTNNFNSVVNITYNRGTEKWTNHSQRGRR